MQFNVAQLLKQPVGAKREYELDGPLGELDPDLVPVAPITGEVRFIRTRDGVLVTGQLATVLEVNCNRCLEAFDLPISIEIEEEFKSKIDLRTGAHLPVTDEDEVATLINEHHIIDLREVVRQDLLLALPLNPLCQEACGGLCPTCGANLNEGPCECEPETIDLRWNTLADLFDEMKRDEGASSSE
ncbi:MAG: DUF177 domain-containing protein [Ardenticatenaceae bacterium]|nr:DUF177 domain-containing protein [Ardenticatenaceae bacterium]